MSQIDINPIFDKINASLDRLTEARKKRVHKLEISGNTKGSMLKFGKDANGSPCIVQVGSDNNSAPKQPPP
jgi:hypothetical protein